ncbi:hypothetical protein OUZ56_032952 [Daphnia magna]|uniref:Uncharacterized protein n=1 Tax=Daphnia magna TaxID=35525 RepID=A0ABQ9ZXA1_9CRUS|nr:hypothetical protein OUZ56_032952 [Daphnia magna]
MSASPRPHTRTYLVPLDRPWTSFGRNWDVNGTISSFVLNFSAAYIDEFADEHRMEMYSFTLVKL